jgi:hypothetical protein
MTQTVSRERRPSQIVESRELIGAMAAWERESDERLILHAADEADAFAAFYRRYERPILAYFLRRTRDPELAADLAAEVFAGSLVKTINY